MNDRALSKFTGLIALLAATALSPGRPLAAEVNWQACKPYCIADVREKTAAILSGANKMRVEVTVLSRDAAQLLFNVQRRDAELPFEFIIDGAYARAYVMGRRMDEAGVITGKAFITGNIVFDTEEFGPGVELSYHVAPVVVVRQGTRTALYVIDPGIMKGPATYEDWLAFFRKNKATRIDGEAITSRFTYGPAEVDQRFEAYDDEIWADAVQANDKHTKMLRLYREQRRQGQPK